MITEYTKKDLPHILNVINDAALKYKGVIPDCCWKEPYMSKQELISEFDNGVRMFGYGKDNILVGVMGIQEVEAITLIRHAYTLSDYQGLGIGKSLLQYLFKINRSSSLLVGTWQDATWAIRFYMKNDFVLHTRKQTNRLLERYWQVPLKQMENSVVLEKNRNTW
ncbi:MAG TPA: GNAT family N-acetyltransferase [Anaerolineales bacterium]|nr:GNAT family N-acetyltransferase [Anaerolineales bacterium]